MLMETHHPRDATELEKLLSESEEEIRQLRLALDVLSPIDPTTGMLNRNGVIDAIQDALNWLVRRSDTFAILTIEVPALEDLRSNSAGEHSMVHRHLEAVLAATLRRVDKVGHLDSVTYAAILREFRSEGSPVLLDRLENLFKAELARTSGVEPDSIFTLAIVKPGPFHQAGLLLERVEALRGRARPGKPLIVEI